MQLRIEYINDQRARELWSAPDEVLNGIVGWYVFDDDDLEGNDAFEGPFASEAEAKRVIVIT